MASSLRGQPSRERETPEVPLTLTLRGELADTGELPAAELGAALQGWDRFLQLAYYSHQATLLELPRPGTSIRLEFRVQRIGKGSFVVTAAIFLCGTAVGGIVGNRSDAAFMKFWRWTTRLARGYIKAKRDKRTLDGTVAELEALAKADDLRISSNREDSEDFAVAINSALANATIPLDSSAAIEVLSIKGQTVDLVIDQSGRAAIRAPFEPPALDEDDPVIEAPVKFVRINKKTGYGLFHFIRPRDESQVGQQRFHCDDKSIRRRANQYTGSFHEDVPLRVRMQRKAYESSRHGHYWLIVGTGTPDPQDRGLFSGPTTNKPARPRKIR